MELSNIAELGVLDIKGLPDTFVFKRKVKHMCLRNVIQVPRHLNHIIFPIETCGPSTLVGTVPVNFYCKATKLQSSRFVYYTGLQSRALKF